MEHILRVLYLIFVATIAAIFFGSVVDVDRVEQPNTALVEQETTAIIKESNDILPESNLKLPEQEIILVNDYSKELECLALNIYKEAGYEPFEGRVAVAQVTMNRVEDSRFPDTICDVVHQKIVFTTREVCQFSWYCDSVHKNRPVNPNAFNESYTIARKVLLENFRLPSLEDALYYHADYVSPNFHLRQQRISQIGAHIFYTDSLASAY